MNTHNGHKHVWLPEYIGKSPNEPSEDFEIVDICIKTSDCSLHWESIPLTLPTNSMTKEKFSELQIQGNLDRNLAMSWYKVVFLSGHEIIGKGCVCCTSGLSITLKTILNDLCGWCQAKERYF